MIPITYQTVDGRMYASVLLPNGQRVGTSIDMAPVVGAVCDQVGATAEDRLDAYAMVGGVDIVGAIRGEDDEVGGRKSRRRRRKARRKKVFGKIKRGIKKVAKPIVRLGKRIAKSKLVKGLVKLAKKIPVYGQLLSVATKGIKGAAKLGKRVGRRVRKARGRIKSRFRTLPSVARQRVALRAAKDLRLSKPLRKASSASVVHARAVPIRKGHGRDSARRLSDGTIQVRLASGKEARVQLLN